MKYEKNRFIKLNKDTKSNFVLAANVDYISFLMQYNLGILPIGTILWTLEQSIEKYCKAILNKYDNEKYSEKILSNPSKYGHNLLKLWNEIKPITSGFRYNDAYERFVLDINEITTDTRYINGGGNWGKGLAETFTLIGCEFRYELMGKTEFMKHIYGLPPIYATRFHLNDTTEMFYRTLHLSIEHGVIFSLAGVVDMYNWTEIDELDILWKKFSQKGLHKKIESECPICNNKLWQNGVRSESDYSILKDFLIVDRI